MADKYQTRFTVRIGPNGPGSCRLVKSYIWNGAFGEQGGPNGINLPPQTEPSGLIDYYDGTEQHIGVTYTDSGTGRTFSAEAECDFDDEDKDHIVDVAIEEVLKVFYGKGGRHKAEASWVEIRGLTPSLHVAAQAAVSGFGETAFPGGIVYARIEVSPTGSVAEIASKEGVQLVKRNDY